MNDRIRYERYGDLPEAREMCLKCTREECFGICDEFRNMVRKHLGMKQIPVREDKMNPERARLREYYSEHRKFQYNGETHTLKEWSDITGIKYKTLWTRVRRHGMSIEDAVTRPIETKGGGIIVTVDGESHTIKEWAQMLGLKRKAIYDGIARGYTPEQVIRMGRMAAE